MSSLGEQVRDWHRGVQAVARGDWDCALRLFSGVAHPPAKICFNVGCVHLMVGEPEAALRAFDQAVTKDTCMAVGFLQRGVANFLLERFLEAVSDFHLALTQLRGNAAIDYTQLGLHFRLQAWKLLYNMASAQCQAGLWTKAANTLEEAISKWPEGAQDSLDIALNQVQKQVPLKLWQVPKGEVFWPPRQYLKHLDPVDFLGKAKVVAPSIPDNQHSDVWPQQGQRANDEAGLRLHYSRKGLSALHRFCGAEARPQVEQADYQSPPPTGLASEGPGPDPSEDSSRTVGAVAKSSESSVTVTVQCHFTVALKAPRGASLSSLRALLAQELLHQAQMGQLSYQASEEKRLWIPIPREESLQSIWRDVVKGPRGLQLQCRLQGAIGRPVLYQVVAQHDYSAHRPEDLDFHRGDTVDVLCEVDEAWLEGHCNGCIGIFPKCFVVPAGACEEALPTLGPQSGKQH